MSTTGSPLPSATEMSSSSAAPSSTSTGGSTSPGFSSQAALYLYTFLVTLVVLLILSSAIVARSILLRRRHRRLVEEAIRNGTFVPSVSTGRRGMGEKPALHDAFIFGQLGGRQENGEAEVGLWEAIMPVAALAKLEQSRSPADPIPPPPTPPPTDTRQRSQSWHPFRRSAPPPPPSPPALLPAHLVPPLSPEGKEVRVTVLIAMPMSPEQQQRYLHRPSAAASMDLPQLEFGVARVEVGALPESGSDSGASSQS